MRRFMYLLTLIGVSIFAVGCGDGGSDDPEEGSAADEERIDDDIDMQEDGMGLDAGTDDEDDTGGAP